MMLFPRNVAYASIAVVAVGDPIAGYVGIRFDPIHFWHKTPEGFMAGLVASFAIASILVPSNQALAGSTVGMFVELPEIVDANFAIPIGAGAAMLVASRLPVLSQRDYR